jgi:hypothetical protein
MMPAFTWLLMTKPSLYRRRVYRGYSGKPADHSNPATGTVERHSLCAAQQDGRSRNFSRAAGGRPAWRHVVSAANALSFRGGDRRKWTTWVGSRRQSSGCETSCETASQTGYVGYYQRLFCERACGQIPEGGLPIDKPDMHVFAPRTHPGCCGDCPVERTDVEHDSLIP